MRLAFLPSFFACLPACLLSVLFSFFFSFVLFFLLSLPPHYIPDIELGTSDTTLSKANRLLVTMQPKAWWRTWAHIQAITIQCERKMREELQQMLFVHCSNFGGRISRSVSGRTQTKTDTRAPLHPEVLRTRFSSPSQLPRRAMRPAYPLLSLTHKSTGTTRHCLLRWVIRRYIVIS